MAYLDYWDTVEKDQDDSLSGVITALQNAAVRVPVGSDVKVRFSHKPYMVRMAILIPHRHISIQLITFCLCVMA